MKRIAWSLGILVLVGAAAALAQPPEGGRPGRGGPPGGPDGGPGGDFRPPPPPVIMALDVDRDHTLSAEEIKNAPEELLTLDKNKDGKLTEDEFAGPPPGAGNRRGARDGQGARGNRGAGRQHGEDRGPPSPDQFVHHALDFDFDKDGKLNADELRKFAEELSRHRPDGPSGAEGPDDGPRGRPRRPD